MADPVKLGAATLEALAGRVPVPRYERRGLPHAIVHIGVGGFHRAHQAVYLDDLLARNGPGEWGICGLGLLPQDARIHQILKAQDCLYTVVERSAAGDRARVIGSMVEFLLAPADPEAALEKMADPTCRIVTLTITEGGYYVDQGTGALDERHPDIQHDLANPRAPRGAFGYLAEALDRRLRRGLPPFTVQSCDNLQANGEVLRRTFLAFVRLRDAALAGWLEERGAFPNAMVDRITPATTDEHRALVRERFGIDDGWPVVCEPFRQWVIEDRFALGRPSWEEVGAQLTNDVHPYERMKIRLLNGSHQALCYVGMLLGLRHAHEAMADPDVRALVERQMEVEVTPLVPPVPGIDLGAYKRTLVERFANPTLRDQLARIGTEGSARIPKFVLPSIAEQLARGGPIRVLTFTVACWFRYLTGVDERGGPLPINDPMAEELTRRARQGGPDPGPLLAMRTLFGDDLPRDARFTSLLAEFLAALHRDGARAALRGCLEAE